MRDGQPVLGNAQLVVVLEVELICAVGHLKHNIVAVTSVPVEEHRLLSFLVFTHIRQVAVHIFGKEVHNFKLSTSLRRWVGSRVFNTCPAFALVMDQLQEFIAVMELQDGVLVVE